MTLAVIGIMIALLVFLFKLRSTYTNIGCGLATVYNDVEAGTKSEDTIFMGMRKFMTVLKNFSQNFD
jgi:hypothetical protein